MSAAAASDLDLSSALRMSVMRLARRMRAQRSDDSLTQSQLSALATLDRHGELSPTSLAEHEKVQPPSMTRIVAALEERGLVERVAHPTDRRQAVIRLTKVGGSILAEDRRRREAWLARQLRACSEEEMAALRAAAPVLDRLSRS